MSERRSELENSRRSFLKNGALVLAGGVIGSAPGLAYSASKRTEGTAPALPWEWTKLDPMEAGSRTYRYYLDVGG